jgi:hypothetical protein
MTSSSRFRSAAGSWRQGELVALLGGIALRPK